MILGYYNAENMGFKLACKLTVDNMDHFISKYLKLIQFT